MKKTILISKYGTYLTRKLPLKGEERKGGRERERERERERGKERERKEGVRREKDRVKC
jgi:hypothetical protein